MYCLRFKLNFVGVNVRYDVQVERSFSFSQKYLFAVYSNYEGSNFVLSKHTKHMPRLCKSPSTVRGTRRNTQTRNPNLLMVIFNFCDVFIGVWSDMIVRKYNKE
jgi:hypothetical protein